MELWKPIFELPDHVDEIARSEKELIGMEVVAFLHDRQVLFYRNYFILSNFIVSTFLYFLN